MTDPTVVTAINQVRESPPHAGTKILAGTVDGDRVAWVEQTVGEPQDGWLPTSITINVAGRGHPHRCVDLETYNPYFGCHVRLIRFFGDALVTVYREKHQTIVSRLALDTDEQTLLDLDHELVAADDLLLSLDHHNNLVRLLRLPDLRSGPPLPVPPTQGTARLALQTGPDGDSLLRWTEIAPAGPGSPWREQRVHLLRLPTRTQLGPGGEHRERWAALRTALADPDAPPDGPDILICAMTAPFWRSRLLPVTGPATWHTPHQDRPRQTVGSLYARLPDRCTNCQTPWWFPAGYYHFLRADPADGGAGSPDLAAQWLAWLDRLASGQREDAIGGWDPAWSATEGAVHLAVADIRLRAAALAGACRAGALPAGSWPSGEPTAPASTKAFRRAWSRLPRRFRPDGFRRTVR